MPAKYIFIDTNIFERDKFRFNYDVLRKTRLLIDNKHLKQLSVSIIRDEINRHIAEFSVKIRAEYRAWRMNSLMILHSGLEKYENMDVNISAQKIEGDIRNLCDIFFKGSIDVPASFADIDEVFNRYNQSSPPFGKGDKKHEFPDAFFLSAINNWAIKNNKRIHVISGDQGVLSYCKEQKLLSPVTDLRVLIQDSFDDFTNQKSHEIFNQLWDQIESELVSEIDELGMYSSVDVDADISNYEINNISRIEEYTFDKLDQSVTFKCTADISIKADIIFPDPTSSFYDKEDGKRFVAEYIDLEHYQKIRVFYSVEFRFDPENPNDFNLINVKIDDPSIIDLDTVKLY